MRTPTRQSGFSLLELMAAVTIFVLIAAVSMQITDGAVDNALRARRARELRYLAEYRLEEVKVFAEEYDDILEGDFGDVDEIYRDFKWTLDIRDVVVFGDSNVEEAEYYFESPDAKEEETATTPGAAPAGQAASPEELRELTLRVSAPSEDGPGDFIELIVLLPRVQ